jgi:hypothetical protein
LIHQDARRAAYGRFDVKTHSGKLSR